MKCVIEWNCGPFAHYHESEHQSHTFSVHVLCWW